ncbi:hypothetical protein, partial [Aromatoleum sp.]|uniref:hypothetical protein n=1 Tax=Aromatoleum sp. TaxID=2307007 RepID=UPI002FCB1063
PNRTVKQDRADDSAQPGVKVGHRQTTQSKKPLLENREAAFFLCLRFDSDWKRRLEASRGMLTND